MSTHLNIAEKNCESLSEHEEFSPPCSPSSATARAISRRKRTVSESEKILSGPTYYGQIITFCREKGHGFVRPADGGDQLFVHISDIDGDFVPKEGDEVSYKLCLIPPKNQHFAAVHVQIVSPESGIPHETWDKSGRRIDSSPSTS